MINCCQVNNCLYGEGEWTGAAPHIPASQPIPEVILDTSTMGQEAVVVKNGLRLCGTGSARGSAPILQDKAYWEVKVQQGGRWSAGIATPAADLTKDLGLDHSRLKRTRIESKLVNIFSWAVTSEGVVRSRGQQEYRVSGLEVNPSSFGARFKLLYSSGRWCARLLLWPCGVEHLLQWQEYGHSHTGHQGHSVSSVLW